MFLISLVLGLCGRKISIILLKYFNTTQYDTCAWALFFKFFNSQNYLTCSLKNFVTVKKNKEKLYPISHKLRKNQMIQKMMTAIYVTKIDYMT